MALPRVYCDNYTTISTGSNSREGKHVSETEVSLSTTSRLQMKVLAVYNGQHVSDSRDMRLPLLVLALA